MAEPQKPVEQKQRQRPAEKKVEQKLPDNYKHIVRIANVDVPGEKQIRFALTKIKGVGINLSDALCVLAKVKKTDKAGNMSDKEIESLNKVVSDPLSNGIPVWMSNRRKDYDTGLDKHILTGTLNFVKDNDLKRLKKTKTLRGMRHQKGLPVRGQKTRSNFRRSKGKVVGVKKKGTAPAKKK
ncbi:30S ribosomal protein S13 [Candidatus Woesearchaeota archaeon]|nr:30S ribosomal protein S13 [Candidatus Woesearchaeota archaeon]